MITREVVDSMRTIVVFMVGSFIMITIIACCLVVIAVHMTRFQ